MIRETAKKVDSQTIRKKLKRSGYNGRLARKISYVNEANREKRLNFAREFALKEDTWWNDVAFSDESKINIFESDGRRMVRR